MSQKSKTTRAATAKGGRMKSRFTKISAEGKELKPSATTWVAVLDNTAGILWDSGEYDSMTFAEREAHCEKLRLCGRKGWRQASVQELVALLDYTRSNPAIDKSFFPNCKSGWYGTGTVDAAFPSGYAWSVSLHDGVVYRGSQAYHGGVRAVLAGQSLDFGILAKKAKGNRKVVR